jgi:hypothetical protein
LKGKYNMSKTKGEGISVKDAWNSALDALGEVDDPEYPDIPTPVDVGDRSVADALEDDDDVEQPKSEEGPTKLSDLFEEEEQPLEDSDTSLDLETVVELPNGEKQSIKELVDGYLRQSDYTQKTQTLAEQRKELDRAAKLYDLMKEDTVGTIARLALEAGLIDESQLRDARPSRAVEQWFRSDSSKSEEQSIEEIVAQKVAEALARDERIQKISQQDQSDRIIEELDAIERDYETTLDDDDRRAILQTALKEGNGNLEHVFLKMQARLAKARANTDRIKKSSTPSKGGKVPTKQVSGGKPANVREAFEWAVAQHN